MEQRDSKRLKAHLETYRHNGEVLFKEVLTIPMEARIPALIQEKGGRERVSMVLSASLMSALGNIEKATFSAEKLVDLAELIIDSSFEDQLAIEDVLLFLRDLLMGKFGKINQKLDYPLFFELLEKYRNQRYRTLESTNYELHLQYKNMGQAPRSSSEITLKRDDDAETMLDLMQTLYSNHKEDE